MRDTAAKRVVCAFQSGGKENGGLMDKRSEANRQTRVRIARALLRLLGFKEVF